MRKFAVSLTMAASLCLPAPTAARRGDDPLNVARKIARRLEGLQSFTLDLTGKFDPSFHGLPVGGAEGPQSLTARLGIDGSKRGTPDFKAIVSTRLALPGAAARDFMVTAVRRGGELFLSAPVPLPGAAADKRMAFRLPGGGASVQPRGSENLGWLTGKLEAIRSSGRRVLLQGTTLILRQDRPGDSRGPMQVEIGYDSRYLPTRIRIHEAGKTAADLTIRNLREGPVDLVLPLPESEYMSISPRILQGFLGTVGGKGAPAASTGPGRRSPFASAPAAPARSPFAGGGAAAAPPAPPSGGVNLMSMFRGLGRMVQGMTKQGAGTGGNTGIPGLNLSEGTRSLLKQMQTLRTGGNLSPEQRSALDQRVKNLPDMIRSLTQGSPGKPSPIQATAKAIQGPMKQLAETLKRIRVQRSGAAPATGGAPAGIDPAALQGMAEGFQKLLKGMSAGGSGLPAPAAARSAPVKRPPAGLVGPRKPSRLMPGKPGGIPIPARRPTSEEVQRALEVLRRHREALEAEKK